MKYKAPVNLTLELLARFRGIVPAVKDAAKTVDALERIRRAYDKREVALDGVMKEQEKAGEGMELAYDGLIPYPPVLLQGARAAGRAKDTADAALMYEDYVDKKRSDSAGLGAEGADGLGEPAAEPFHSAAISAYEGSMAALSGALTKAAAEFEGGLDQRLNDASRKLAEAESFNAELSRLAKEAASTKTEAAGSEAGFDDPDAKLGTDTGSPLADIRKSASDLALDDSFFADYHSELEKQRSLGASVSESARRFASVASASIGAEGYGQALMNAAADIQKAYGDFRLAFGSGGSILEQRRKLLNEHRAGDKERQALEGKANEAKKSASSWLEAVRKLKVSPEQRKEFEKAFGLYKANLEWNESEDERIEQSRRSDASGQRDEALKSAEGWLDSLSGGLVEARDSIFFGEYVYERFSRFEPILLREALNGDGSELSLEQMEAEFILYGMAEPAANVAAAYGELFAFRLAIRTMEGLIECRGYGHPLVILAAALAYGFTNALSDVVRLVEKESVPLSKYAKAETVYGDYARFFLIARAQSAGATARCIAVMERELGLALTKAYTYVSGEGVASLKLWFFPGLLKLFGRSDSMGGTIKGNRYEAAFTADSSYQ